LVLLPAGEFDMGTPDSDRDVLPREKPQHRVQITKPFYLGCHEVSVGQFRQFVSDSGYKTDTEQDGKGGQGFDGTTTGKKKPEYSWRNPGFQQTDEHPVVNVSWNDADAFCTWLSRKEGKAHSTPTSQTAHDFSRVRSVRTPQSESCTAQESHATMDRRLQRATCVSIDESTFVL